MPILLILLSLSGALGAAPLRFCAVGDILLDRGIRRVIEAHDPAFPLSKAKALIQDHDLAFCNLESCLSERGTRVRGPFRFRGDPRWAQDLADAGFHLASVANNHTLDYGREAFSDTLQALRQAGLQPIGGGSDQASALEPVIVHRGGLSIAFIGNLEVALDGFTDQPEQESSPGPAYAEPDQIIAAIRRARRHADIVVLSQHWGTEYHSQPDTRQVLLAHRYIDAGADLLLGHHPHVLQPLEMYHGGVIVYSLGNFVFDQHHNVQTQTVLFECEMDKNGVHAARFRPMRIGAEQQPALASKADAARIQRWIKEISKPFCTAWTPGPEGSLKAQAPWPYFQAQLPQGQLSLDARGVRCRDACEDLLQWDAPPGWDLSQSALLSTADGTQLYAVLSPQGHPEQGRLAAFKIGDGRLDGPELALGNWDIWKLSLADVDDDGQAELCVGSQTRTPGQTPDRRLQIFARKGLALTLKPSGAVRAQAIRDFAHWTMNGHTAVLLAEEGPGGKRRSALYRWGQGGYSLQKALAWRNL